MNVTDLARRLKITTAKLKEIMPQLGFDIGAKAIKVPPGTAQEILRLLSDHKTRDKYLNNTPKDTQTKIISHEAVEKNQERLVKIPPTIVVKDLAKQMDMEVTKLILVLMKNGVMASLNQSIDYETATIIAGDLGFQVEKLEGENIDLEAESKKRAEALKEKDGAILQPRPPIIVVMGHVDHGKTKLLDAIRETNIVDSEAGGITQHIGAYQTEKNGRHITFIDTPGHEAFSAMRSRGAQVADIAILVVAADDGVQPQTIEALSFIQNSSLPFIVAINKIDKEGVNIDKIKSELAEMSLTPEDWGGDTICVPISAKQKINIDDLLETVLLVADMEKENIMANPDRDPVGTIIESHIDKGEGPVATVLIQTGTLKKGDQIVIGNTIGRIRAMKNWQNKEVNTAQPSTPVKILGLKSVPQVGEILKCISCKKTLRKISKLANQKKYSLQLQTTQPSIKPVSQEEEKDKKPQINIILKADVLGSVEAIKESLDKIPTKNVKVNIIKQGLGNITEKDVEQSINSKAHLVGFSVQPTQTAKQHAVDKDFFIQTFNIIYDLINYVKQEASKLIHTEIIRENIGKIKILGIFRTEKNNQIVGGKITHGKIIPNSKCQVLRQDQLFGQANITELQCNKESVTEAVEDQECGLKIEGFNQAQIGDILEIFTEKEIIKTLE